MVQPPQDPKPAPAAPDTEAVLRAKYLDYCSARVAEILLRLSPDEIFVMARETGGTQEGTAALSYDAMVEMATTRIYRQLDLPRFDDWVAQYKEDPARFEGEILGFWELDQKVPSQGSP